MKAKTKKDEFLDLPDEFKDKIASSSPEEIDRTIAQVAKDQEENTRLMQEDQDLAEKRELAKEAAAGYREGTKANRLKIRYCLRVLHDKGKE